MDDLFPSGKWTEPELPHCALHTIMLIGNTTYHDCSRYKSGAACGCDVCPFRPRLPSDPPPRPSGAEAEEQSSRDADPQPEDA